jgi:hypothetical protein
MTQKDKSLLLQDLCGRLYCGVICQIYDDKYGYKLLGIDGDVLHIDCPVYDEGDGYVEIDYCKPYLRPMSSMSKEEEDEWCGLNIDPLLEAVKERHTRIEDLMLRAKSQYRPLDWLNAHHFDFRNLIEKGLALEAPEDMYNLDK